MNFEERLVSGAPLEIYKTPGTLFEFRGPVMDASRAVPAGIHYLFELYGTAYYRHTPDLDMIVDHEDAWAAPLLDRYRENRHCHAAASIILRIDDAVVHNSVVCCGPGEDAPILYESFRHPDRDGIERLPGSPDDLPFAKFQRKDRDYLYLGSLGSLNYGHFLIDDLPRAKAWLELRRRLGLICVFIMPAYGGKIDAIRVEALRLLVDPAIEVEFILPDRPYRLRNLHYVTPVSFHPRVKNPDALNFLRSRVAECLPALEGEPAARLFIARRPPHSRAVLNFDELWCFLAGLGFTLVEPETLDFAEQVTLFRSARIVIGQMGAGMTTSLFCRPATNLIHLAPTEWKEPFYLDLAAAGGQQYNILAGPRDSENPTHLSDFTVPLAPLYHRLAYMGIAEAPSAQP